MGNVHMEIPIQCCHWQKGIPFIEENKKQIKESEKQNVFLMTFNIKCNNHFLMSAFQPFSFFLFTVDGTEV